MVFMRKRMVESLFQSVLRCFENVLRRNVPTSGSKEPDVGTFLYNRGFVNHHNVVSESE